MDLVQGLLGILKIYKENSDFIETAVKDVRLVSDVGQTILKRGLEERKRKHILKALALLAPSDVPAKVIEIDGVDDAELSVCKAEGWLNSALAIYLRHGDISNTLAAMCIADFGKGVGAYTHSVLAAVWDHVELGDQRLTEVVKSSIYECADSGRLILENASNLCETDYELRPGDPIYLSVQAFEASRDSFRRFALVRAVLVELGSGKVILYDRGTIKTSDAYTLDKSPRPGLEFPFTAKGHNDDSSRFCAALAVLCSMFAEVSVLRDWHGRQLVNRIVSRLERGLTACKEQLDSLEVAQSATWIPSRSDLKNVHNRNDESTRSQFRRRFKARDAILDGIKMNVDTDAPGMRPERGYLLECLSDRHVVDLGRNLVKAYEDGKVNIRRAKSGTLIFVPHSEILTMTTHGMDDALLATLVKEMNNNPFLVADPLTFDVRACMTRSFESARREFKVSTLHEDARRVVGAEHYQGVVREAVSLLARLGATVPKECVGRSCFYDVTRDLMGYRDLLSQVYLRFDRGVTLNGLACDVSSDGSLVSLHTDNKDAFIIAKVKKENLRHRPPHNPDAEDDDISAMEQALQDAGLAFERPVFDVYGELHLTVTRSDPGRGFLCLFAECEAR
ncbi:MAG: hypothetical protein BYD32DRAFT_484825 [Podila humilis]|nr:MAG: hypothetical protein BYD32DRAFT_484825 [Podila humilis]